jgi:hypothetical protein
MNPRANHSGARAKCQRRGLFEESSLGSFSAMEPSLIEENFAYIKLNTPVTCPPRATCPWSTGGALVASFINDVPGQN